MNMRVREQYLNQLWQLLSPVPEPLRKEWMYDYEEHFRAAAEQGRSEEAAAAELGDPRIIARELLLGYRVEQAEKSGKVGSVSRAVFATVGMGFVNLVFVLGPYLALLGVVLALWAVVAALAIGAVVAVIEGLNGEAFNRVQGTFIAMTLIGLAMLSGAGMKSMTRGVMQMTIRYLKFNGRIIGGSKR
ncbi:putative membrane protein [Paenibacillus phyllosphaerae]|uniref:Putative membrane protein n=1 Tax=Paenibacillus phyllosphaerae TaxID=274593 RepID=A0A7W5FPG7_9BACL|nr:DUF1700 domain-containing protein [Paenibacillus phyllosphaerae]MBB3112212.1 putative membrane protein [Paenibacillus phyllosphaerae]